MTRAFLRLLGYEPHKIDRGGRVHRSASGQSSRSAPTPVVDPSEAAFARLALVMDR